jgi:predicted metalloprotease with PDZ domain
MKYALAVLLMLTASTAFANTIYTVRVPEDPKSVHVSGSFVATSPTIGMYITRSPQLAGGQADLVRDLVATSGGKAITCEYVEGGDWRLDGVSEGARVDIEYNILTEHDQYSWGPGIDEVAYRQDDGLFFTGFSLLIVGGMDSDESIDVRFELPSGWHVSTPWEADASDKNLYHPRDMMDLLRNCMFMGTHLEESIEIDDFTFVLAIGGDFKRDKQMFVDAMTPLLPAYVEMFGGMPSASRYLAVINPGRRSDGGAFPGSYSMLISGELNEASSAVWGHGIAHELMHFWNGHTLKPANPSDEEWFKEGFTDYLTLIQLSRSGLDRPEITYRKLENLARRYIIAKRLMGATDSMRAAGAQKHQNRFLVYGGGALVAFALDVRIREASGNEAGLDDMMKAMYTEFGLPDPEKRYTFEDIVRIASEVSGEDQSDFFARFVDGTEYLDVGPYFDTIGMQMTTFVDEFYLAVRESATARQDAMSRGILGR